MSSGIKIAIVGDSGLWSESFLKLISTIPDMQVVYCASNGEDLINYVQSNSIDVVLLSLDNRSGMDGIKTLELVKKENLNLKIIMMSIHHERKLVEYCLELGAKAFLSKNLDTDLLVEIIKYVNMGKNCAGISRAMSNELYEETLKDLFDNYRLTVKELEVLYLFCKGKSIDLIAAELGLTESIVQHNIESVYQKTNSKNKSDLISFGTKMGICW